MEFCEINIAYAETFEIARTQVNSKKQRKDLK